MTNPKLDLEPTEWCERDYHRDHAPRPVTFDVRSIRIEYAIGDPIDETRCCDRCLPVVCREMFESTRHGWTVRVEPAP